MQIKPPPGISLHTPPFKQGFIGQSPPIGEIVGPEVVRLGSAREIKNSKFYCIFYIFNITWIVT